MQKQLTCFVCNRTGKPIQVYDDRGRIIKIAPCERLTFDGKKFTIDGKQYNESVGELIIVYTNDDYGYYRRNGNFGLSPYTAYLANGGKKEIGRNGHSIQSIIKRGKDELIKVYPMNEPSNDHHTTIIDD